MPPTKHDIAGAIRYYVTMCKKYGVDLRLNTPVDEELMRSLAPDAIVLATGSVPAMPPIEGIDNASFLSVADVLDGRVLPGAKVLIAGGGMSGVETGRFPLRALPFLHGGGDASPISRSMRSTRRARSS